MLSVPFSAAMRRRMSRTSARDLGALARPHQRLANGSLDLGAKLGRSAENTGARQRQVLPGPSLGGLVFGEGRELRRHRRPSGPTGAGACRPRTASLRRRRAQDRDQALREAGIILRRGERFGSVRLRISGVVVIDHDEIEVGRRRHLTAAELAHGDDDSPAASNIAVGGLNLGCDDARELHDQPLGEQCVGCPGLVGVDATGQYFDADEECLLAADDTCAIEDGLGIFRAADLRIDHGVDLLGARRITEQGRIDDGIERDGDGATGCGPARGAVPIMSARRRNSAGLALSKENSCTPAGRRGEEVVEARRGEIGIGRFGERRNEQRLHLGQKLARRGERTDG